jgi:predicted unusual protein kinase regulating ubiquinone biosynthesis (AarF/ABC1/UbiB family)
MIEGISVDKCVNMDIKVRERISKLIMRLSLMELFEFRYMQTDPNWSNFFYNPNTNQVLCNNNNLINYICIILFEIINNYISTVSFIRFWSMQIL